MQFDQKSLKGFADAAQSLRLYRRAELLAADTDEPLVEKLYVDPLQNDAVLETMMRPNTTFLIGRKGTGKSTVFQRAQHDIRKSKKSISAYIDIKTVYESAEVDPEIPQRLAASQIAVSETELKRILLYRAFTKAVFSEIQKEIKSQVNNSVVLRFKESLSGKRNEVIEALDELLDGPFETDIADITAWMSTAVNSGNEMKLASKDSAGINVKGSVAGGNYSLEAGGSANWERSEEKKSNDSHAYSKIMLRTFSINKMMERLEEILSIAGLTKLYIFIDDFSELPIGAMTVFVDTILAPLNNWSNELIKFKVAAYPGRVYLGKIDKTKIDEIYLDPFQLYGGGEVAVLEEKAIDFTTRLINSRIKHYLKKDFSFFCDSDTDEIYRQLFFASMGNPRILGHVLNNIKDSSLVYGEKIGIKAVQDAAAKYYEDKIEPFFGMQKYIHKTFDERSSIFSLKELLENVVERARALRNYKSSALTMEISGRTPSSHFHMASELEFLLSTLELNFFVTKYFEMKDRDKRKVSVYAINYGLCMKYNISFGRPKGRREYRTYFIERIFDSSAIFRKYLHDNQEIKCDNCGAEHGIDKLEGIRLFDMMCPTCKRGRCEVVNLSRKYESVLQQIDDNLLLPSTELGILEALYSEKREMAAAEIAGELDCSYQLIGKRGKIMEERGLVSRKKNEKNRRLFKLTDRAIDSYFTGNSDRTLDMGKDE